MTPPNVLLITLDAVRPDRLRLHGGPVETPNLERLAKSGVAFSDAWAQGPVTWISHASVFTGLWPLHHGLTDVNAMLDPGLPTLAELLARAGYETAGWPATATAGSGLGFGRGFDLFEENYIESFGDWAGHFFQRPPDEPFAFVDFEDNIRRWSSWKKNCKGPWFAWLHYFDCHHMTGPVWRDRHPPAELMDRYYPRGFKRSWRKAWEKHGTGVGSKKTGPRLQFYDAKIAWFDHWLGRMIDELDLSRDLAVVFSDHGEDLSGPFPDHDDCTEGELRVVMVMGGGPPSGRPSWKEALTPRGISDAGTVGSPARLIDLAPTVYQAATGEVYPVRLDGISLFEPDPYPRMVLAMNGYCRKNKGKAAYFSRGRHCPRKDPEGDKVRAALEGLGYL